MSDEIDYGVDPELVIEFVDESEELLSDVTNLFITLESNPEDKEAIDKIFRTVHTIKGNSAFFNLMKVKSLAHIMEDLMNLVREDTIKFNDAISEVLIQGIDFLKGMLENVRNQKSEISDENAFNTLFESISNYVNSGKEDDVTGVWKDIFAQVESFDKNFSSEDQELLESWKKIVKNLTIVSPLNEEKIEIEEVSLEGEEGEREKEEVKETAEKPVEKKEEKKSSSSGKTMRVYESTIDGFLDFVGELVVVGEMYDHIQKRFAEDFGPIKAVADLKKNNETFNDLSTELQRSVLDVRRISIKTLLQKAPRIIRDIATARKKKINVEIQGENTLIDKSLLESVEGPFVHMIRNAADHGIETPEKRIEKGKEEAGHILIAIEETDEALFIKIKDDGAGINKEIITNKAISNGILTKESAANISEQEVFHLLFAPGFSTAEEVTDISGRGVGMDVVKKNIEAIGGQIHIESVLNEGSQFTIQIPKTVCVKIMDGFLVASKGNRYVLPMISVGESFKIDKKEITETLGEGECIMHHGIVFPVVRLSKLLDLNVNSTDTGSEDIGVILDDGKTKKPKVLLVDEVLGTQQVVIKDIEGLPNKSDLIAGGVVLGDERVAIVLDLDNV